MAGGSFAIQRRVTIGIVAGEASGDALAATLIHAVRARLPQARFVGIAGPRMEAAGCEAWYPLEKLVGARARRGARRTCRELVVLRRALFRRFVAERVPVFVGVDAPDFNLGLESEAEARAACAASISSARRSGRGAANGCARSAARSHRMLALFPFEPPLYEAAGIPVTFVGHPLAADAAALELAARGARAAEARRRAAGVRAAARQPRVGARDARRARAARGRGAATRCGRTRNSSCRSPRRPTRDRFEAAIYRLGLEKLPLTLLYGHATDALRAADVALVASGTATLEAALARCPHVIFYRVNRADRAASSGAGCCCRMSGCPTFWRDRFVVPELLQDDATAENLAQAAANLYDDTVTRRRLEALFAGFAASLAADTGGARRRSRRDRSCARRGCAC